MASSQRIGRCRNASGAIIVAWPPVKTGWSTAPNRPMSWYGGSQLTPRVSLVLPSAAAIAAELIINWPWLIIAPRGAPVDPDVYCRSASWSVRSRGRRQSSAAAGSASSRSIVVTPGNAAFSVARADRLATIANFAAESSTIASSARAVRPGRGG